MNMGCDCGKNQQCPLPALGESLGAAKRALPNAVNNSARNRRIIHHPDGPY
jgi:hypothetical protein